MNPDLDKILSYAKLEIAEASSRIASWDGRQWATEAEICAGFGLPTKLLQKLRESFCGPFWRPYGHERLYDVEDVKRWIGAALALPLPPAEPTEALAQKFIRAKGPHEPGGWQWWHVIRQEFKMYCLDVLRYPRLSDGWERILRFEIENFRDPTFEERAGQLERDALPWLFSLYRGREHHRTGAGRARQRLSVEHWGLSRVTD